MKSRRIDELLVERDMVAGLKEAQARILAGECIVGEQRVDKVGARVDPTLPVRLKRRKARSFVSRGGEKLEIIFKKKLANVAGLVCLDLGASTGGFTDCLLKYGASRVYAVDVGYGILDWRLRNDERVINLERTHAAKLTVAEIDMPISFLCADLSCTSLAQIIAAVSWCLAPKSLAAFLIKPQFELPPELIEEGGIVRSPELHHQACEKVSRMLTELGYIQQTIERSPILGTKGNVEFLWIGRSPS